MYENERDMPDADISAINDVDITDDFMFAYIMRDPEICVELLRFLLPGRNIESVRYLSVDGKPNQPETQKTMLGDFGKRGVRLDAYLDDGKTVYNIEMQTTRDSAIAKRSRLYGAYIDINQLGHGGKYDELKPSYVIFICKFDPFRERLYRYSFENICAERKSLALKDGSYKLFFNTTGTYGDISAGLKELLEYMNNSQAYRVQQTDNALIEKIDQAVNLAKSDEEWRRAYMTYQIHMREAELRGIERGEKAGINKGIRLGHENAAKELLLMGLSVEDISKATHLTLAEIRKLEKDVKP